MQDEKHSQGQPDIQVVELKNKYHAKVGLLKEKETLVLLIKLYTLSLREVATKSAFGKLKFGLP